MSQQRKGERKRTTIIPWEVGERKVVPVANPILERRIEE